MTTEPGVIDARVLLAELESRIVDVGAAARHGDVRTADDTVPGVPASPEPPD